MKRTATRIDQDELRNAIKQLTEGQAPEEPTSILYRCPLEVAREEWRKQAYANAYPGLNPEVKANWPK